MQGRHVGYGYGFLKLPGCVQKIPAFCACVVLNLAVYLRLLCADLGQELPSLVPLIEVTGVRHLWLGYGLLRVPELLDLAYAFGCSGLWLAA